MTAPTEQEVERLDARALREALGVAEQWLALNREAINAVNVYPIPDGDTGTNMLLTFRAALEAWDRAGVEDLGGCAGALARGALLGARGNSGVILSQMMRGFALPLDGLDAVDGVALAAALGAANRTAYEAVNVPVEGTMLTVLREAADAAANAGGELVTVLDAAVVEAEASVERTPELLPRLREAGVVDAGGLGVAVLLAGLRYGARGEALPAAPPVPAGAVDLDRVEHEGHGYCTEYIVNGPALDGAALDRDALTRALEAAGGESILVVGDARTLHVHVHLADPGPALSAGVALGAIEGVKVDNMQAQHEQWAAGHEAAAPHAAVPALGAVAVATGPGIARAFRDLGVTPLLATNIKPSAGALLEAARGLGREHVFLLPNDKDVLLAAEQAAAEAPGFITVIPTRSLPAGLSAALAYEPVGEADRIAAHMRAAIDAVRAVEVTRAVRSANVDGVAVEAGDAIALLDGTLVARAPTPEAALLEAVRLAANEASELVTVYLGADAPRDAGAEVRALLEAESPGLTVEVLPGGQPHYLYIAGVE